jgi:hypothetical protein
MEEVSIFHGHLVYFMTNWYILWTFGIFCCHLVHFPPFRFVIQRKIWQPCYRPRKIVTPEHVAQEFSAGDSNEQVVALASILIPAKRSK